MVLFQILNCVCIPLQRAFEIRRMWSFVFLRHLFWEVPNTTVQIKCASEKCMNVHKNQKGPQDPSPSRSKNCPKTINFTLVVYSPFFFETEAKITNKRKTSFIVYWFCRRINNKRPTFIVHSSPESINLLTRIPARARTFRRRKWTKTTRMLIPCVMLLRMSNICV